MASGEEKLKRTQVDQVAPSDTLLVLATDPVSDKVDVSEGYVILSDRKTLYGYGGGTSSSFTPLVGVGMNIRWDLLCFDLSGATPILKGPTDDANLTGSESPVTVDWWNSIPDLPAKYAPLAAIRITESANPVELSEDDIVDLRPFFSISSLEASLISYSATPANWSPGTAPDDVSEAIDTLAARFMSSTPPVDVGFSTFVGNSYDSARADHIHAHDVMDTVSSTRLHDGSQITYNGGGSWWTHTTPTSLDVFMSEISRRVYALESQTLSPLWYAVVIGTPNKIRLRKSSTDTYSLWWDLEFVLANCLDASLPATEGWVYFYQDLSDRDSQPKFSATGPSIQILGDSRGYRIAVYPLDTDWIYIGAVYVGNLSGSLDWEPMSMYGKTVVFHRQRKNDGTFASSGSHDSIGWPLASNANMTGVTVSNGASNPIPYTAIGGGIYLTVLTKDEDDGAWIKVGPYEAVGVDGTYWTSSYIDGPGASQDVRDTNQLLVPYAGQGFSYAGGGDHIYYAIVGYYDGFAGLV